MWWNDTKVVVKQRKRKPRSYIWVVEATLFDYAHYSTNKNDPHEGGFGPWSATAFYTKRSTARLLAKHMRKIGPEGERWRVVKYTTTANQNSQE